MSSVQSLIAENTTIVFSKSYCPYCTQTKNTLNKLDVEFVAIEMDQIPGGDAMHQELKALSKQNSVPNTYVGGVHIGGNDDLQRMVKSGEFAKVLEAATAK